MDLKNCDALWLLERDMGDPGGTLARGESTGWLGGVTGLGEDELLTRNIFRPCSSVGVPGLYVLNQSTCIISSEYWSRTRHPTASYNY